MSNDEVKKVLAAIDRVTDVTLPDRYNTQGGLDWSDNNDLDLVLQVTLRQWFGEPNIYQFAIVNEHDMDRPVVQAFDEDVSVAARRFIERFEKETGMHASYDYLTREQSERIWKALWSYGLEWAFAYQIIYSGVTNGENKYKLELIMDDDPGRPLWSDTDVFLDYLVDKLIEKIHKIGPTLERAKSEELRRAFEDGQANGLREPNVVEEPF